MFNIGFFVATWTVHTTLELFACVMVVMRASTGMAGVYRNYTGSGLAGVIYCKVVASGTLIGIGMYGGRVSVIVHTMYCFWKIVYPIHQRKHYRRWMIYVGIILPWLVGTAMKMTVSLVTADVVKRACVPRANVQSLLAFKVCAVLVCTFCILYCIL